MASWGQFANQGLGALTGLVTGLISAPFLGAWYTYQTTSPKGWNFSFVFSVTSFLPRLLFNSLVSIPLSTAAGVFHGARFGIYAGWSWPTKGVELIHRSSSALHLINNAFAIETPYPPISLSPLGLEPILVKMPKLSMSALFNASLMGKLQQIEESKEVEYDGNQLFLNLQGATLNTWSGKSFVALSHQLNSRQYTCLNICHNNLSNLSPVCIARLMQTLRLSSVQELYLSYTQMGLWNAEQVRAFAKGLVTSKITTLHLCANGLD